MIESVAIIGMGLMGGSLGLALRVRGIAVRGYARRAETRKQALAGGFADTVHETASAAVAGADLVVLCTPVLTMPALAREIRDALKPGCVVTDVGSTKQWLDDALQQALAGSGAVYVGSHPMAGSEKVGMEAARADLYLKACVIVTVGGEAPGIAGAEVLRGFWESVGAVVTFMTPEAHDRMVARTSHLPHLVAALLMATVDRDDQQVLPFCGPGFRDTTRIAAGSEDVWHDIVKSNATAIRDELDTMRAGIDRLTGMIAGGDFEAVRAFLATSRHKRETFRNFGQQGE
jgi:prephenate dehydrogenase